jgi:hypothetical protein
MTPFETPILYPCSSCLLLINKAFGKLPVEPKTLGIGNTQRKVVSTPLKCFSKMVLGQLEMIMEDRGVGGFSDDIGDY